MDAADKREARGMDGIGLVERIASLEGQLDFLKVSNLPLGPAYGRLEAMRAEAKRRGIVLA